MKKTLITIIGVIGMITSAAYGQDLPFRYDTLGTASGTVRNQYRQSTPENTSRTATNVTPKQQQTRQRTGQGYWTFGGGLGLGFGDYTNINIEPQVGYRFNNTVAAGIGVNYNYYNDRDYDYTLNYFGMHLSGRIYPVQFITLFVQPEVQRRWGRVWGRDTKSEVFGCLLLGGGVVIPAGMRGGMTMSIYYDVIQNEYSPYGNNIGYSVGYSFRL